MQQTNLHFVCWYEALPPCASTPVPLDDATCINSGSEEKVARGKLRQPRETLRGGTR